MMKVTPEIANKLISFKKASPIRQGQFINVTRLIKAP